MFKKIAEFFQTKTDSAIIAHTSVQDHYEAVALKIIGEIKKLRLRHVEAARNVTKFEDIAQQKDNERKRGDREILRIRAESPEADVSTRVKLALVYKHAAEQFRLKASQETALMAEIEANVRDLTYKKDDLAVRLQLIRETESAREAGLENVDDIIKSVEIVSINIEEIMNKVQVFKGEDTTSAVIGNTEMADYLAQLETK